MGQIHAMPAALAERDAARAAALAAVRSVPAAELGDLGLPPDGRISFGHLRRWHPDAAARVAAELDRLSADRPEIAMARAAFREAALRCAWLRGLEGAAAERAARRAARELDARLANALLRVAAPDRTDAPKGGPRMRREPCPGHGPGSLRMAADALTARNGAHGPGGRGGMGPTVLREAAAALRAAAGGSRQLSDEVGDRALRLVAAAGGAALAEALRARAERERPRENAIEAERRPDHGEVVQR